MKTFNEYLKEYKALVKQGSPGAGHKKIKVALAASFNVSGFKEVLYVQCRQQRIAADIYVAAYAQYNQEILDRSSGLYRHQPDVIILFVDTASHLGDYLFNASERSDRQRRNFVSGKRAGLESLIEALEKNTRATIIVHNFEVPAYSPLGILENKQPFGMKESIEDLNRQLAGKYKKDPRVYVYDFAAKAGRIGQQDILDHKMYYMGDIKVDLQLISSITADYLAYIRPMLGASRKCLVLDLDNTLWGGVVGEEGIEGIRLGPTPEGRSYWEFQKYILSLFKQGVILAINSKNTEKTVLQVLKEHPHMVLKEEHFAAMQINWENKVTNMKAIAAELNIGLDSLVFMDDDTFNREVMARELPEVHVVDMPDDPALYLKTVQELDVFSVLQITREDKGKSRMYAQNRQRQQFEKQSADIDQYLEGLRMNVTFFEPSALTIPRMSQLTLKTNQWNMTTRRYQENDIAAMAADDAWQIRAMQVEDKFGDNGIIGLIIVKKQGRVWRIDTCLMSCRVIGRRLEEVLVGSMINLAKKAGVEEMVGEFIPSGKNGPAMDVFRQLGFKQDNGMWIYPVQQGFSMPGIIKVRQ